MLLSTFFQEIIDVAKSEQTSLPVRICCVAVTSLVFVIAIASLYLVAFVVEGPGLLRRIGFFLLGSGALGYYLEFLRHVMRRSEDKNKG